MKQIIFSLVCIGMLITPFSVLAGEKPDGGLPGSFMNLATDARSLGMGRAGVADPESGIFWNPATVAMLGQKKFMFMSTSPLPDCRYNFISYHHPFQYWSLDIGYLDLGIDDIVRRDSFNLPLNTFSSKNNVCFLAANYLFLPTLSAGIGVKIVDGMVCHHLSSKNGVDIGLLFKPTDDCSLGVSIQNLVQPRLSIAQREETIPLNIKVGFMGRFLDKFVMALDIDKNSKRSAKFHFGTEYCPWEMLRIRTGYDRGLGLTFGFGLKKGAVGLDYAWLGHEYETIHRISVALKFGRQRQEDLLFKREVKKVKISPEPKKAESLLLPVKAPTTPKEKVYNIAVADLRALEVSASEAMVVSDFLRNELVNTAVFEVLERSNMEKLLAEQAFQSTGCTEETCAVKMGKLLNVQKIIIGSFSRAFDKFYIMIRVIDVEKGMAIMAETVEFSSADELSDKVKELANLLAIKAVK